MKTRVSLFSVSSMVVLIIFVVLVVLYSCVVAIPHGLSSQLPIRHQIIDITGYIGKFIPVAVVITIIFDLIWGSMMILWEMYKHRVYMKGRFEERKEWEEWNYRRRIAEDSGRDFNEPPPSTVRKSAIVESAHVRTSGRHNDPESTQTHKTS